MFNLLYSKMNQQLLKRTSAIKIATMKITDDFHYEWKPLRAYHKIDTFLENKDEREMNDGTDKSMKNALYQCPKRHLIGWSNVKKWKKSTPYP